MADSFEKTKAILKARILKLVHQYGIPTEPIRFAIYEDDEALNFFRPNEFKDNAEHTAFVYRMRTELELELHPLKIAIRKINLSDYWRYLAQNKVKDSPEQRAKFIS